MVPVINRIPVEHPSPSVAFYPFAEGGLLCCPGSRQVWVLNPSSAFLWCMLGEVEDFADLVARYAEVFAVSEETGKRDVTEAIAVFRDAGLLAGGVVVDPALEIDYGLPEALGPQLDLGRESFSFRRSFGLADHALELCCSDLDLGNAFASIMGHLSESCSGAVTTQLAVVAAGSEEDVWDIYLDGRGYVEDVSRERVLPHLVTLAFVRFSEAIKANLLFHAAVVGQRGQMILLPGEAGSGKTTLAATLAARGFSFYSDELAVLDIESLRVTPFLLPMSIKPGSVPVLEDCYPGLSGLPVHPRADGKQVRYLMPPVASLPAKGAVGEVQAIVFPRYVSEGDQRMGPLEKGEAMRRLVHTGSSNRDLTARDVEAMIALVEKTPCYELIYCGLDEAVSFIEGLFIKDVRGNDHVWGKGSTG